MSPSKAGEGGSGSVAVRGRAAALDKARALLGVSRSEFEAELEAHRPTTRPLSMLERPGLGAEKVVAKRGGHPAHQAETKVLTSVKNQRLKRKARAAQLDPRDSDSDSDGSDPVSKAASFSKSKKSPKHHRK